MTQNQLEDRILELARMALDEPWADVQGCATVLAKEIIQSFYNPSTQVAVIWSIEDVQGLASELSDEQAMEVLEDAKNHHDASVGMNWDVLEYYVERSVINAEAAAELISGTSILHNITDDTALIAGGDINKLEVAA
ncbi:hypothetical protein [Paenarthrobacter sp. MSM-2-10-13]|uniref:hypothetical protein n=1 Tax=Paenarthrobacter sp. MSM-2-10-13 TaxID=2717318 RepID=UPI001AA12718|nr:hypothetical protein [Paenarthrobacter sp. MSM-2-10-13]